MTARMRDAIDTLETLPELLRSERLARGLTQAQAGSQIGIAKHELCRYELGRKRPSLPTALRLLRWLDDSTDGAA